MKKWVKIYLQTRCPDDPFSYFCTETLAMEYFPCIVVVKGCLLNHVPNVWSLKQFIILRGGIWLKFIFKVNLSFYNMKVCKNKKNVQQGIKTNEQTSKQTNKSNFDFIRKFLQS